ncbi:MAG: peptidoglycan DD-metalloendopeptidase family protein [bacterium]
MKRIILILISILIFSLLAQPVFVVQNSFAQTAEQEIGELNKKISERKEKIKQLEDSIAVYKENVKEKQLEAVSLKNQLSIIENHVARIQADIDLTDEKIQKAQLEIDALKISIDGKEKLITKQKSIIGNMLRNINREQNKSYLEILLTNNSFSEFYDQIQNLETVYQDLGRTVKSLRLSKEELDAKKKESEKYQSDQEELKKKLVLQRQDQQDQSNYKNGLLAKTQWSESQYQTLLANLKTEYQAIEDEVSSYEREIQKKLAAQNKISQGGGDTSFNWPTNSRYITSYFHDPDYPYRHVFEHSGIDIGIGQGTPLYAASSGYVAHARLCYSASCYSYVLLVHTGSLSTLYGHMSKITVVPDQFVNKGDLIGYSGGTPGTVGAGPFVTGPHLHFEVRSNGIPVNPLNYLK